MSDSIEPARKRFRYKSEDSTDEDSGEDWFKVKIKGTPPKIMQTQKCSMQSVRIWENVGRHNFNGTIRFNVVSYNVLAQCLLDDHAYLYVSSKPLNLVWPIRSARLYNEIIGLEPDIICLQEVESTHLNSFYARFEENGYSGIYKKKTGDRLDGCAIYFRTSMFFLKEKINVEFYQKEVPTLNRDNVGLIVKLAPNDYPNSDFIVATTHLLYNPMRTDVRLAQMRLFLAEIDRLAYDIKSTSGYLPIILTGDFNSPPECPLIQLLDTGHINTNLYGYNPSNHFLNWMQIGVTEKCQHLSVFLNRKQGKRTDFNDLKIRNSEYKKSDKETTDRVPTDHQHIELFNTGLISHPFNLSSVYTKYKADGSCEATTFQKSWQMVDYIYFSPCNTLHVTDRLRLPTVVECAEGLGRTPNKICGSDHFSLATVFELTSKVD